MKTISIWETFVPGFDAANSSTITSPDFTETTVFPFQPTTLKTTSRGLIMAFKTMINLQ